ncbi:PH domain-containing protein [Actinokineospora guangxiensis]|uniref:PH domain-containing protein n=1 Tax=Actinokineospora guangxiensis TaxID=1490288 RepID=A0ABW0EFL0_9PSEU
MSEQEIPSRLVFRVPQVSILAALLVAICATPVAAAIPALAVIYLLPVAAIVWIVRVRTVADASGLAVRKVVGGTTLAWDDLKGLLLSPKGTVSAVRADDTRVALPSVRTRHLSALALISGGRITDPTPSADTDGDTVPTTEAEPVHEPGSEAVEQNTAQSDSGESDDPTAEKSESARTETRSDAE